MPRAVNTKKAGKKLGDAAPVSDEAKVAENETAGAAEDTGGASGTQEESGEGEAEPPSSDSASEASDEPTGPSSEPASADPGVPAAESSVVEGQDSDPTLVDGLLPDEQVAEFMAGATRRYAFFSGVTVAAARSKFEHDPDSMDEFVLGINDRQRSQFAALQTHLRTLKTNPKMSAVSPAKSKRKKE